VYASDTLAGTASFKHSKYPCRITSDLFFIPRDEPALPANGSGLHNRRRYIVTPLLIPQLATHNVALYPRCGLLHRQMALSNGMSLYASLDPQSGSLLRFQFDSCSPSHVASLEACLQSSGLFLFRRMPPSLIQPGHTGLQSFSGGLLPPKQRRAVFAGRSELLLCRRPAALNNPLVRRPLLAPSNARPTFSL